MLAGCLLLAVGLLDTVLVGLALVRRLSDTGRLYAIFGLAFLLVVGVGSWLIRRWRARQAGAFDDHEWPE